MKRLTYILLAILLLQLIIPSQTYLHNKSYTKSYSFNKVLHSIKPLQQTNNLILLGPNNETQPVVNEGNTIRLKLMDAEGNPILDPSITFTSDSPDIATVDNQGNVQGKLFGFATITAKRGNTSTKAFVVVARVQQAVGMTLTGQMEKDTTGSLYLSDPSKNIVIRKAGAFAAPIPFAGNGTAGNSGDNGDPTQAQLNGPVGIAVDNGAFGGVYIADSLNHKIRKIQGKKISSVLGSGSAGIKPELMSSDEINFTRAEEMPLNFPQGIAVDVGGQVFIADSDNAAIYLVDFGRKRVKLFAGQPGSPGTIDGKGRQAMFTRPIALNLNSTNRILNVLDQDPTSKLTVVRQIAPDGTVRTIKKKRATIAASDMVEPPSSDNILFINASAISSDGAGNVYVIDDSGANLITFPVNQDPQLVSLAQPGPGVTFNQATSITVQGTQSFVVDAQAPTSNQAVKVVSVGTPKINSLSQASSRLEGGLEVVISGSNFAPESQLTLGDGVITNFVVESATSIRFIVPRVTTVGDVNLTITTRGGVAQQRFTILPRSLSEFATGEITTIAGGVVFVGDGGPATSATLNFFNTAGVTLDGVGNVFISDGFNNRIRKVDAQTGVITTVAGNGQGGFSGDGGPATSASINQPNGITIDNNGNLFILDTGNRRIRKVDGQTGIITTIAGNGCNPRIEQCSLGDGGQATSASFNFNGFSEANIAVDTSGNIFIADTINFRVRKVDAQTGVISTFAGSGRFTGFAGDGGQAINASLIPIGVTVDSLGNLFIIDNANKRIRKVDAQTRIITTIAGDGTSTFKGDGGPATSAGIDAVDIFTDGNNNLFITDGTRIRKIDGQTGIITTVAGNGCNFEREQCPLGDGGPATAATLAIAKSVVTDGMGNLFIADINSRRVRKVDAQTGIITTIAGNGQANPIGNGGPATSASISQAFGVAVDKNGDLFVADAGNNLVRKVDNQTKTISTFAGNGMFNFSGDGGPAISASLSNFSVSGVQVDELGNLFIIAGARLRKVDSKTGVITTVIGNGNFEFSGDNGPATSAGTDIAAVAIDAVGNIFIAARSNHRIRKVDARTGIITTIAGKGREGFTGDGGPAINADVAAPEGIAVDKAGNIFFADAVNNRIRKIDAQTGIITSIAGSGRTGLGQGGFGGDGGPATSAILNNPSKIVIDGEDNIFFVDSVNVIISSGNNRIRRIDAKTGIITTVAGNGQFGFSGDGEMATNASLNEPLGLAIDGEGNLFIADRFNNRVRVIKAIAKGLVLGGGQSSSVNLMVSPSTQSITAGLSISYTVAINRSNFTGPVDLNLRNINGTNPTGLTFAYSNNSTTGSSSTLTINTTSATPAGTYTFASTGVASGATVNDSNQFSLTVSAPTPSGPTISNVTFNSPNFIIAGNNFGTSGNSVRINGTDVSKFIKAQSATQIMLKGKQKKLKLVSGANSVVVTVNGVVSNSFTFNFFTNKK